MVVNENSVHSNFLCFNYSIFIFLTDYFEENLREQWLFVWQILYFVSVGCCVFIWGLTADTSFWFFFFVSFDFFSCSIVLVFSFLYFFSVWVGRKVKKKLSIFQFLFVVMEGVLWFCYYFVRSYH